jgi:hypothetical protein
MVFMVFMVTVFVRIAVRCEEQETMKRMKVMKAAGLLHADQSA